MILEPHICESFGLPPTPQIGRYSTVQGASLTRSPLFLRKRTSDQALRYSHHISSSTGMPNALLRSNVVASNFRPNLRARCQELFTSVFDGRRAISAYLSRYLLLAESQKLSG